jgi:hypothetical protein
MACLTSAERALILAEIVAKQEQLDEANTALLKLIKQTDESYKFDSNEGAQQAKRRKLKEYKELIEWLEGDIARLYRKLNCRNVINMNLRRKYRGRYYRRS